MILFPKPPQCIFCDDTMNLYSSNVKVDWDDSGLDQCLVKEQCQFYYVCINESCFVNNDFARYKISLDGYDNPFEQEYTIDDTIYVKVFPNTTLLYYLQGYFLMDEVRIPRAMWLNPTNISQTLTTIKTLIIFS